MRITINPALLWGAVFSVPAVVVDKYMKLASPEQLKTLLWVLRHASEMPTAEQVCDALHMTSGNVREYLTYWQQNGILQLDGEVVESKATVEARTSFVDAPVEAAKPEPEELPQIKPTQAQVLQRMTESAEIKYLFDEAQKKFGRTLGYDGQCTLLMMIDHYGLPVEVVLMIIEHCVSVNKTANSYIAAMAKTWAHDEIDTIEKAEERINILRRCNSLWKELSKLAGITAPYPTAVQSDYLRSWSGELGYKMDMIFLAYEEMANHCTRMSFAYMNKVLRSWHDKGIQTPEAASEDRQKYLDSKKPKTKEEENKSSYDISELEHHLMYDPIVYKKKD